VAELCAVSYVLMVEQLERFYLAAAQAAMLARALGRGVEVPDWFEVRANFDEALARPPKRVDRKQLHMLQALGLRD